MEALFVHPDNVEHARRELAFEAAIIARPDAFLANNGSKQLIIETTRGVHLRCYAARAHDVSFLIVYGRFDRVRSTSQDINFALTQEAVSMLGIKKMIGTFVTGSIRQESHDGDIFIVHDFVGLGGHNQSRNRDHVGFRNVDMLNPFCPKLRHALIGGASSVEFKIYREGVYACFHGFPRIETAAELDYYEKMGWHVVGQTLDPEATLAREAGCHYAALAATIDDRALRAEFLRNDPSAREKIDEYIGVGREKMFTIFLNALPELARNEGPSCNCEEQATHVSKPSKNFYYRPPHLRESYE
jgi:purine nucleoside phosphorylase